MAPHSSTLAWKIPWMEEPGRLPVHGVAEGQTRLNDFTFMHWRRKWQPTPVFLPGESQGWGSLVGCRLWGRIESDTTEAIQQQQQHLQPQFPFSIIAQHVLRFWGLRSGHLCQGEGVCCSTTYVKRSRLNSIHWVPRILHTHVRLLFPKDLGV